jgi:hypothetical protein
MIGRKYIDPTAVDRAPDRRLLSLSERLETTEEQDEADEREAEALLAMQRRSLDRLLQRIPPVLEDTLRLHLLSLNEEGGRLSQREIGQLTGGVCQPVVHYRIRAGLLALQRTLALKVDLTPTEVFNYVQNLTASPSYARSVSLYWRWHTASVRRVLGPSVPSQSTLYEQVFGGRVGGSKGFTVRFPNDPVSVALLTIRSWGGFNGARPPGFERKFQ